MKRKIAVRAPNWLGDVVMCTPFLKRLIEKNPEAEVHVLCRPAHGEIFSRFPGVKGVRLLGKDEPWAALVRRVAAEKFQTGYVLPPSFSSALLFFMAGVPERIGYATDFRRFFLTRALALDERFHYVRRYLGLLGEESREAATSDLFFPAPPDAAHGARAFLLARGFSFKTPCLAVAPGSQAPGRRWEPERFAAVIGALAEKDWPAVVLVGAPGDLPWAEKVRHACSRPVINLCGATDLVTLGDLLRQCSALLTNESGMMHVAWAVGTPTVALAGPSEPRVTSPFGAPVRVLQHREIPCVPCIRNDCYLAGDDYKLCLKSIAVSEVVSALNEVVKTS
ncbi:MAG TPA: lipopolysaccharide heptosyltransferase II [Elusimicrobiota bacterium]|nr:lipopolysaccharide heptosyltransferase II [Elusimicrobiota bacterium]